MADIVGFVQGSFLLGCLQRKSNVAFGRFDNFRHLGIANIAGLARRAPQDEAPGREHLAFCDKGPGAHDAFIPYLESIMASGQS